VERVLTALALLTKRILEEVEEAAVAVELFFLPIKLRPKIRLLPVKVVTEIAQLVVLVLVEKLVK
jgi:hypothetical protein